MPPRKVGNASATMTRQTSSRNLGGFNNKNLITGQHYDIGGFRFVPYGSNNLQVFKLSAGNQLPQQITDATSWQQACLVLANQLGWLQSTYASNGNTTMTANKRATSATASKNAVAPVTGQANVSRSRNVARRNVSGRTSIRRNQTPALATSANNINSTNPA